LGDDFTLQWRAIDGLAFWLLSRHFVKVSIGLQAMTLVALSALLAILGCETFIAWQP
jgi:hypothetical protein